jgi:acetyl esterase/lipase
VQSGDIDKPEIDEEWITVPGGPTGSVRARVVRPAGAEGALPVVLYIHGAGWVFGNAQTHDRLVRELAMRPASRFLDAPSCTTHRATA